VPFLTFYAWVSIWLFGYICIAGTFTFLQASRVPEENTTSLLYILRCIRSKNSEHVRFVQRTDVAFTVPLAQTISYGGNFGKYERCIIILGARI
jgi:hypothetical protein